MLFRSCFRRTFDELAQAQLALSRTELHDVLEATTSYVSMIELGMYEMTAKVHTQVGQDQKPGTDAYAQAHLRHLSDRELEVFDLIGKGLRKRDIAARLNLSVNTIETHRASVKKKLRLSSAAELARFAFLQLNSDLPRS